MLDDNYVFRNGVWTPQPAGGPSLTQGAWDSVRGRPVSFGLARPADAPGAIIARAEAFERIGQTWVPIPTEGITPPENLQHAVAYDEARRTLWVFAGAIPGGAAVDEMWSLPLDPEARPAALWTVAFGSSFETINDAVEIAVTVRAGGRGYALSPAEVGATVDGVRVCAWHAWAGEWVPVGEGPAGPDAPEPLELVVDDAFRFVDGDGNITFRIEPAAGSGSGAAPPELALDALEARVTYVTGAADTARCGDGIVQIFRGERCDDGNRAAGDGCDDACIVERGFTCTSKPSACFPCGDGTVDASETCDDGNRIAGDGCDDVCQTEP